MSTRSLTMVYKNGEYKLAQQGLYDGDVECMGCNILDFLMETDICKLNEAFENISFYTEEELDNIYSQIYGIPSSKKDTIAEIRMSEEIYGGSVAFYNSSEQENNNSYERPLGLSFIGGNILSRILSKECKKVKNSINFAAYSALCEWGYVIDLDKNTFEVYIGFNEEELTEKDRFYWLEKNSKGLFHPIKLAKEYDLNNLPDYEDFIDELMGIYEQMEEE